MLFRRRKTPIFATNQRDDHPFFGNRMLRSFDISERVKVPWVYFCVIMGLYGISFWLPTFIKATGVKSPLDVGLLSAIPYAVATVAMILVSRSADQRRERRWHFAIPAVLGAIGLIF